MSRHWSEKFHCAKCGKTFRSTAAQARHRHNLGASCRPSRPLRKAAVAAAAAALLAVPAAKGHDLYKDFWSGGSRGLGRWCCSGNAEGTMGDCSPATYRMRPDGSAVMRPRQFPDREILVPKHRILWTTVPGGEAFEAHWCGRPKQPDGLYDVAEDPDPGFVTFCAAIAPGGV
jgi:hypothetical protein